MNSFFYILLERINLFILKLKKDKIYSLNEKEIGINIGCEINTIPQFRGIDGSFLIYIFNNKFMPYFLKKVIYSKTCANNRFEFKDYYKKLENLNIIHHNINYGLPFKNNSVIYIFSAHFFEHLGKKDGENFLKECYRILKQNGRIRIIVPDLEKAVNRLEEDLKKYQKNQDIESIQKYFTIEEGNHNYFSYHKRMYDFKELKRILKFLGFKKIKRMKFLEGNFPFIAKLDKEGLIVEAVK